MLSYKQKVYKRLFDIILSLIGIIIFIIPILVLFLFSSFLFKEFGIFFQRRIGVNGKAFTIFKIKSMKEDSSKEITSFGNLIRKYKLDELPQLYNVLIGSMSIVGPRPDLPGYADKLHGEDRIILKVKPGLTSLATIKYANEEELLSKQENPKKYNDKILWPEKVELNKEYVKNYSFKNDILIILKTIKLGFTSLFH